MEPNCDSEVNPRVAALEKFAREKLEKMKDEDDFKVHALYIPSQLPQRLLSLIAASHSLRFSLLQAAMRAGWEASKIMIAWDRKSGFREDSEESDANPERLSASPLQE